MSDQPTDRPDVIARPPRFYGAALAIGLIADYFWPLAMVPGVTIQYWIGGALIVIGVVIASIAFRQFHLAGTNVPTPLPTTALVTGGIYRFSRNPIYVAMTAIYVGIAVAVDMVWILAMLAPVLVVMRYGVIAREEVYLDLKFGDEYRKFKRSTRRWV